MSSDLDSTFCEAIVRGWGVAANCRPCGEVHKLTDAALAERFLAQLDRPLSGLKGRLKCPVCGNKQLVIFAYQAGAMNWPELSKAPSDMLATLAEKERVLRERARTTSTV